MKWISVIPVLSAKDGSVSLDYHARVLLEQACHSDVKVVVSFNGIWRKVGCADELSFNNVETLKLRASFCLCELFCNNILQALSFVV